MTIYRKMPYPAASDEARRARMRIRTKDPAKMTKRAEDWCFDFLDAAGFQAGSIPADGAAIGTLVDVAGRSSTADARPVGVQHAATALINSGAILYESTGGAGARGMIRNGEATQNGLKVAKDSLSDNVVGHPPTEGFLDFLVMVWLKPDSLSYWSAFGCANNNNGSNQYSFWGAMCNGGGNFLELLSNRIFTGVTAGAWSLVGVHYRFDTGTGAIYVRMFVNGAEVQAASAGTAVATTTTAMAAATLNNARTLLGSDYRNTAFKGLIARARRVFTNRTGDTLDPLLLVQQEYAANHARVTGG